MKARALIGGRVFFFCAKCRRELTESLDAGTVTHPTYSGFIRKIPSACPFAGKVFKMPTLELEEL